MLKFFEFIQEPEFEQTPRSTGLLTCQVLNINNISAFYTNINSINNNRILFLLIYCLKKRLD